MRTKRCASHKRLTGKDDILPVSMFSVRRDRKGGYRSSCKVCEAIRRNPTRPLEDVERSVAARLQASIQENEGRRRCAKCRKTKSIENDFYSPTEKCKQPRGGSIFSYCKDCSRSHRRKWSKTPENWLRLRQYRRNRRQRDLLRKWAEFTVYSHQKRQQDVNIDVDDVLKMAEAADMTCAYCGVEIQIGFNASLDVVDRKKPITRNNICLCCVPCNSTKSKHDASELLRLLEYDEFAKDLKQANERLLSAYYASFIPFDILVDLARSYRSVK